MSESDQAINNMNQEICTLTIHKDGGIESTDELFDKDDLTMGANYCSIDVYYQTGYGEKIEWDGKKIINQNSSTERQRFKAEMDLESSKAIPSLMFQMFGEKIKSLSEKDRKEFPICRYRKGENMICGIYLEKDELPDGWRVDDNNVKDDILYYRPVPTNAPKFYIDYHGNNFKLGNPFGTIELVKKCLQLWGGDGDKIVIKYKKREGTEDDPKSALNEKQQMGQLLESDVKTVATVREEVKDYSKILLKSKNVIFRGAPGTGKTYLAKQIAAYIVSGGKTADFEALSHEGKSQIEFVQFHPSYDYTDFVEGLRQLFNDDGSMGFELKDGVFKAFVNRAREDLEKSEESDEAPKNYVFIIDEINRGEI